MTAEARIARAERGGTALALVVGLALRLAAPETSIATTRPMLLVAAGAVLLAVGLARDLARIALEGRPVATAPDRHPVSCASASNPRSASGAVAAGLAWRLGAASAARPVSVGGLVLALAVVATLGHLTRNLVVVLRREPAHRNVVFWS